jgi:hypothetical protein
MKITPQEKRIRKNFLPGTLTKTGFLGTDDRHVHDIIESDLRKLQKLGFTQERVADRLQWFIDEGKKGLEGTVDLNHHTVRVQWQRGMIPCPFGERGLHHKLIATVIHKASSEMLRFSQLNVHMIRNHGFFEGEGGSFRIDPDRLFLFFEGCPIESQEKEKQDQQHDS